MSSDVRVLITGGAGFVGSWTVSALLEQGVCVATIDNLSTGNPEHVPAGAQLFEQDIRDEQGVLSVFRAFKPTHVLHCASDISGRLASCAEIINSAEINVTGSVNVLKAVVAFNCRRFVFSSTAAVYGEVPDGESALEHSPLRPQSPYGASKAAFEMLLVPLLRGQWPAVTVLRYANVYGPGQQKGERGGVIPTFFDAILNGYTSVIYGRTPTAGDGGCKRDFVSVEDVVRANLLALSKDLNGIYNVSTGVSHHTAEVLQIVASELERPARFSWSEAREGEIKNSVQDCSKIIAAGWTSPMSLREGIRKYKERLRKQFELFHEAD